MNNLNFKNSTWYSSVNQLYLGVPIQQFDNVRKFQQGQSYVVPFTNRYKSTEIQHSETDITHSTVVPAQLISQTQHTLYPRAGL